MANRKLNIAGSLQQILESKRNTEEALYRGSHLWHLYVHVELAHEQLNAQTKANAKKCLTNIGDAAFAVEYSVASIGGSVIEVQGDLLHAIVPLNVCDESKMVSVATQLHEALKMTFARNEGVLGWRMSADKGRTLIVDGVDIHGDRSLVSLGNAANRPAKKLYQQLAISNEDDRKLKRGWLVVRRGSEATWKYYNLNLRGSLLESDELRKSAAVMASREVKIEAFRPLTKSALADPGIVRAQAASMQAPENEDPYTGFGWVMRTDLDGFTSRVAVCYDDPVRLAQLAQDVRHIMQQAANFAEQHEENLVQLPWAGDKFTAAVVYQTKDDYLESCSEGIIEFSIDFNESLDKEASHAGFGGWAHGVAGGPEVHANAQGNIFIGSVSFGNRRFLIGAGLGMGRSNQAFIDIAIKPDEMGLFDSDYKTLSDGYSKCFEACENAQGQTSSLFKKACFKDLKKQKYAHLTRGVATKVTVPSVGIVSSKPRPYFNG